MFVDQFANEKILTQSRSSFQHVLSNYPIVFLLLGCRQKVSYRCLTSLIHHHKVWLEANPLHALYAGEGRMLTIQNGLQ